MLAIIEVCLINILIFGVILWIPCLLIYYIDLSKKNNKISDLKLIIGDQTIKEELIIQPSFLRQLRFREVLTDREAKDYVDWMIQNFHWTE